MTKKNVLTKNICSLSYKNELKNGGCKKMRVPVLQK